MYQRSPPAALPRFFLFTLVSVGAAFAVLVGRFWLHVVGGQDASLLGVTLIGMIALVALLAFALVCFILAYQVLSTASEARWREAVRGWTTRWERALRSEEAPARYPVQKAAIEAWLRLRESEMISDPPLEQLGRDHGLLQAMLRALRTRRRARRLAAIEDLARARMEEALEPLLAAAATADLAVQHAALRAAARTLARGSPALWERGVGPFTEAMARSSLHSIPFEGVLLILEGAAPPVVAALLGMRDLSPGHLRAALAASRHLVAQFDTDDIGALAQHQDPEVRSAALQTLAALGGLSAIGVSAVQASLDDDLDFLRIHATRAAGHLPEAEALDALWKRLGDPSWWVRIAAAETLVTLGDAGIACLERAARSHPDRFARDMAQNRGAELRRKAA